MMEITVFSSGEGEIDDIVICHIFESFYFDTNGSGWG